MSSWSIETGMMRWRNPSTSTAATADPIGLRGMSGRTRYAPPSAATSVEPAIRIATPASAGKPDRDEPEHRRRHVHERPADPLHTEDVEEQDEGTEHHAGRGARHEATAHRLAHRHRSALAPDDPRARHDHAHREGGDEQD